MEKTGARRRFRRINLFWLGRVWQRISETNASLLAAAVAFYMMLSLFPALATLISAYGLIADPQSVGRQLNLIRDLLPPQALGLMSDEITALLSKNNSTLGFGFLAGLVVTLWSARSGATALMAALNGVYRQVEIRSFVRQQLIAVALTVSGIAIMIAALIVIAVVPAILAFLPFASIAQILLALIRWPLILCVVFLAFTLVYRYAPYRDKPSWRHVFPGALVGAILWILGSGAFSIYVSSFGSYDKVYGSIGAVVVLLIWFYVSAYALLIGAAIDGELE